MVKVRTYTELKALPTYLERYKYLRLDGSVGMETFGSERYANQMFYRSSEWKHIRDSVIIRDGGCDLGVEGRDIFGRVLIHHMNPIRPEDIESRSDFLLNPEYLITTTHQTHQAIHYGDEYLLTLEPIQRTPNDTCPWKHKGGKIEMDASMKHGIVIDTRSLMIHKEPYQFSDIVCTINRSDEVQIDEKGSFGDFFKVCTASGQEGYCLKSFIQVTGLWKAS